MLSSHRLIEIFFFDAGGGHRSAASALRESMAASHPGWSVRLVNLQDLLDNVDPIRRVSRYQSQDIYNGILKRGWTFGTAAMLRGMQAAIRLLAPLCEERLRTHWRQSRPDLVVSVIPNFNGVLLRALRAVHPAVPYVTIMTDIADCPPHFWQEQQDQHMICGSDRAMDQARAIGYAEDRLHRASGMILHPKYYNAAAPGAEPLTHAQLNLDPALPTALIMFGGYGSGKAAAIAKLLAAESVQAIVMCGHNGKLRSKLQDKKGIHAVGFTDRVPDYMRLADFFIGKPGPGSISEALHMGLPVIVECNRRTMPQERYNATWVEENGLGVAVKNLKEIPAAAAKLMQDKGERRARIAALDNRAVFEIPAILETLIRQATAAKAA